jgi:hypothetical protein
MKSLYAASALLLAATALSPIARAEGPRPSSEHHWSGMTGAPAALEAPTAAVAVPSGAAVAPPEAALAGQARYVWQEGYDPHGKWHGHWTLVQ